MSMSNALQFEVRKGAGYFIYPPETFNEPTKELNTLLEAFEDGDCPTAQYLKGLKALAKREPELIDAYAHLSMTHNDMGNPKAALTMSKKALDIALRLIPEDFKGKIDWDYVDNRPFIRALRSAVMSCRKLRKYKEAVRLLDTLIIYDPEAEIFFQGVMGCDLLRSGNIDRAIIELNKHALKYSHFYYDLALAYLIKKDWVNAATYFRKGFVGNGYIGEILNGNPHPLPLAIFHDDYENVETALGYMKMYGALWCSDPVYLYFARWIFNNSTVMAERAEITKCKEELLEGISGIFTESCCMAVEKLQQISQQINSKKTSELIKPITDEEGYEFWPWMSPTFISESI